MYHWLSENKNLLFFLFFLSLLFFFSLIFYCYTDDLFIYDFEEIKKKENKKLNKITFIIKNINNFLITLPIILAFINVLCSRFFFLYLQESFPELTNSLTLSLLFALFMTMLTEIIPRLLTGKIRKIMMFNSVVLNITHLIAKIGTYIWQSSSKRKITNYSEKDVIRYTKNLTLDNIVEKEEAQLVQAAFNFDDINIETIMVPLSEIVFIEEKYKPSEIRKIHLKNAFSYYPVLNNEKKIIGIFNFKQYLINISNEETWQKNIDQNFLTFNSKEKANKLLKAVFNDKLTMAIITEKDNFVGIVTCKDVLYALTGKKKLRKE